MCGIAGILSREPGDRDTELRALQVALHHRGPDDQGLWQSTCGQAGLVHTRLAILDLSAAGHQPMLSADGRYALVFNGEIYNFHELRAELEREGVRFQTHTDTEVLLHLYARDGTAMLKRLRGMFVFCLWDSREQVAFLARDPLGIKPLYYADQGARLVFASELQALQKAGLASSSLNAGALMRFFSSGSVAEPDTLLKDVQCLPAGHTLVWKAGAVECRGYWQPSFGSDAMELGEAVSLTRAALLDSVQHHFVSDVPVGVFLSGGIDSTVLAALALKTGVKDLRTFSIGVDDEALDESDIAARTAQHLGTRHHVLKLNAQRAAESFPRFLSHMDQPSIDGFNTFTVAGFAREQGMKVVLSGLGGDELFGGYPSFQKVPQLAKWARRATVVPSVGGIVGNVMERTMPRLPLRRVGSLLQQDPTLLNSWRAFRGLFTRRDARSLAARYAGCRESEVMEARDLPLPPGTDLDQVSACELTLYMRNQLLKDSDVMSMAHGLELRVPLVDRVLFETVSQIPSSLRLRAGKQLLLEAVPEVPSWVAHQGKRGFLFPYEKWLGPDWGADFAAVSSRIPDAKPTWYQRWSVFMLERWLEKR